MNDQRTITDVRAICRSGEVVAIWHPRMLERLAKLNKKVLAQAKRLIRARFGNSCAPQTLARAVRELRQDFLQSERAKSFDSIAESSCDSKVLGRKKAALSALGRLGGMRRVAKGFATMTPEKRTEVWAAATEGRKRARAKREAARAACEPVGVDVNVAGLSHDAAVAVLAAHWNLSEDLAVRRLQRERDTTEVQSIGHPSLPGVVDAPAVTIGPAKGTPCDCVAERFHKNEGASNMRNAIGPTEPMADLDGSYQKGMDVEVHAGAANKYECVPQITVAETADCGTLVCMRVAIYSRVSTKDKGQEAENQTVQLREFAARQGWTVAGEYEDHMSGKRSDRPEMERLMADAAARRCDVVLAWALDRFTREGVAETFAYIKRLKASGVEFWSLTEEHFRTTGPAGELMMAIAAWIAKQERIRISERTKVGLEAAKRKGKTLGRPRVVLDRVRIAEMRADGSSLGQIAAELGLSKTTVARVCG